MVEQQERRMPATEPFSGPIREALASRGWEPPSDVHHNVPQTPEQLAHAERITQKLSDLLRDSDFFAYRNHIMELVDSQLLWGVITNEQYLAIYSASSALESPPTSSH